MRAALDRQGFALIANFISPELAKDCVTQVELRVQEAIEAMGYPYANLESLMTPPGRAWSQTPPDWPGRRWGGIDKQGWIQGVGAGRIFEAPAWQPKPIMAAQWAALPWLAGLHEAHEDWLTWVPERTSVKVAGCKQLPAHLDLERQGGQVGGHRFFVIY